MKVYTDSEGRILAVGTTDDVSLIEHTIADDEQNPFIGWSDAKVMCYRVTVDDDGHVTMMTPYVPSNLIDKISQMQTDIDLLAEQNSASIGGGDWDEHKFYREGDCVTYGISLCKCLIANYGIEPSDTRHWKSTNVSSELNELSDLIIRGI